MRQRICQSLLLFCLVFVVMTMGCSRRGSFPLSNLRKPFQPAQERFVQAPPMWIDSVETSPIQVAESLPSDITIQLPDASVQSPVVQQPEQQTADTNPIQRELTGNDGWRVASSKNIERSLKPSMKLASHRIGTSGTNGIDQLPVVANNDPSEITLLDFHAEWCAPCLQQSVVLHSLESRMATLGVSLVKVNYEDRPDLVQRHRVSGLPTLILLKNGQELKRHTGLVDSDQLMNWLQSR